MNCTYLGGIIANTRLTREGSLIEAIFTPVNSRGYLTGNYSSGGRFLAIYKESEILDPIIYSEKREITIAAEFIGFRKGMIEEMEYTYPMFEIKDIYLWDKYNKQKEHYYHFQPYYYPLHYYRHGYYYPWWY